MKRILIFKQGLYEEILEQGFQKIQTGEILRILEAVNGISSWKFTLKHLLDKGIEKKTALIMACAYEVGRFGF
jgi:hypothetical protein